MEAKSFLCDYGELAKTGVIYNETLPLNSSAPYGVTGGPSVYQYSMRPVGSFQYELPDGYLICKNFPEHPTISPELLCAFQLVDKATMQPINKYVGWYYTVNQMHTVTVGSGLNVHRAIEYNVDLEMRYITPTGDPMRPYDYEAISQVKNISGTYSISAYGNVIALDQRYIGFVCHFATINGHKVMGVCMNFQNWLYLSERFWYLESNMTAGLYIQLDAMGDNTIDPKPKTDPNEEGGPGGGPSRGGGGGGDRDDHSDPVPIPPDPTISATDAGFVTLYNPSLAELQAIGDEVYTDTVWEVIKNFFKSPDEYIVGLGIIPVQPLVGASKHPRCGVFTFNTAMPVVISEYVTVDCGTIPITEYYGSAFDYAGMTSVQIYLPFIGFRDLDVDDIMATTLGVVYKVDVYNGNCVAFITVDGTIKYTFSGNCMQQVPTASQSFDNAVSNGIALAAAVVGAVATGGATAAEEAATGGAEMLAAGGEAAASSSAIASASNNAVIGSSMVNVMNAKPNVTRSGALGSSAGLMGVQYPYIVRKIPRQSWPANYNEFAGYPCNMTLQIGSLTGFFVVDSINLTGVPAMDIEIAEILAYLKGGAIV